MNQLKYQPLDYAKVTNTRKNLPPRPTLSESTHQAVKENLKEQKVEMTNKINENQIKIKKPQQISKLEKESRIIEMMRKQSRTVGLAPIL